MFTPGTGFQPKLSTCSDEMYTWVGGHEGTAIALKMLKVTCLRYPYAGFYSIASVPYLQKIKSIYIYR
jgi:hypothetical protein